MDKKDIMNKYSMDKEDIVKILEGFKNKYGATANDRRKGVETTLAKQNLVLDPKITEKLAQWINEGTPGSVPNWVIDCCHLRYYLCYLEDYYQRFLNGEFLRNK